MSSGCQKKPECRSVAGPRTSPSGSEAVSESARWIETCQVERPDRFARNRRVGGEIAVPVSTLRRRTRWLPLLLSRLPAAPMIQSSVEPSEVAVAPEIEAQFEALLTNDLWLHNARHANEMASLLAGRVAGIDGVEVTAPPEVNAVFATVPAGAIEPLIEWSRFWVWDEDRHLVRWMCSFDTTVEDIDRFVAGVEEVAAAHA